MSVLQIAGDSEVGVKLLEKSLIKDVQVSLYTILCAGYFLSILIFFFFFFEHVSALNHSQLQALDTVYEYVI